MTGQDVHFAPTRGTEHDWDQHLSSTPPRVAATELLTDRFRCALDELGLGAWPIYCTNLDVDVERLVADARQRQAPVHHYPLPLVGPEQPQRIGRDNRPATPTLFVRRPGINRPGRFDVVLEVRLPDTGLRRAFFERRLQDDAPLAPDTLAEQTHGLSFAHLEEVLRTAGLHALHAGRSERSEADLREAVKLVRGAAQEAETGFRGADGGFGFRHGGA